MQQAKQAPSRQRTSAAARVTRGAPATGVADNRPAAIAQRKLAEAIEQSPQAVSQRALSSAIHDGLYGAAQRKRLGSVFGETAQLADRKEEELLQGKSSPVQLQGSVDEELLQGKFTTVQREGGPEEEELLQGKFSPEQRQGPEEEDLLQGKFAPVQRQGGPEEEELLQGKFSPVQRQGSEEEELLQGKFGPIQRAEPESNQESRENNTGLPDNLKAGIESISGISLDNVKVHYNSAQPAQLNALAYAQGSDIHVAPGQEQHLPHEAWHVVQQAQGRVKPTMQMKDGVPVNDDAGLEHEAFVMRARAAIGGSGAVPSRHFQGRTEVAEAYAREKPKNEQGEKGPLTLLSAKQGRVQPTVQTRAGVPVNDDRGLEREADVMGAKALQLKSAGPVTAVARGAAGSGAVVQCVTLNEVFAAVKDDLNQRATFSAWIQARAGDKLEDWQYLLSRLSLEQVKEALKLYAERTEDENARNSITIEDVINNGGDLGPPPPDKQVDVLMLSSPHIGTIIAQKQSEGINVAGQVVALDDAAFAERHWQEFLFENQHLGMNDSQKATLKLREMAKVDRVDGFQAKSDGKIYMRPTKMGLRVAIHEGVHKYGGQLFEALLGHVLNEGATDYIAMLVCAQVGAEIAPEYYPNEKKLLIKILSVLKISDEQLFAAYFADKVESFVEALVGCIGAEHAVLFRHAKTAGEAARAFINGQKLVLSKR